ncbi:MAG: hypothetical protein AB1424_08670 [Thermodesulfobacteriota bacterium]
MSSYVESLLRPGERIIYQPRLSRLLLAVSSLAVLVCIPPFLYLSTQLVDYLGQIIWNSLKVSGPREDPLAASIVFPIVLGILYFAVKYLYAYIFVELALTDQRIIGRVSRPLAAFPLQPVDLPLADIAGVHYTLSSSGYGGGSSLSSLFFALFFGIIEYLANYGTVEVVDQEGRKTKLRSIVRPKELARQIRQAAGLGEFAVSPAGTVGQVPGLAEQTLQRDFDWKSLVAWTFLLLIMGAAVYAYFRMKSP